MEWLDLGPVPAEESCAQVGSADYGVRAYAECSRYKAQLKRMFGPIPEGARLRIKSNPHDFGSYLSVEVGYDPDITEAVEWAFKVESNLPSEWDETKGNDDASN